MGRRLRRGGRVVRSAADMVELRREAEAVRVESLHGHRPDVTLKRESRSVDRVGSRARLGGGMTESDARLVQGLAAARMREGQRVASADERVESAGFGRLIEPMRVESLRLGSRDDRSRGNVNNNNMKGR